MRHVEKALCAESLLEWDGVSTTAKETIQKRYKLLEKAKKQLKRDFRGLDSQIDTLIKAIEPWYLGTTATSKPTVVNLWSITGLGKTTMVRNLMTYLNRSEQFLEITFDNRTVKDSYNASLFNKVTNHFGMSKDNLCLFLDEFQNMRTVNADGTPVSDTPYQDLWTLLSDGRFFSKARYIDDMKDYIYTFSDYIHDLNQLLIPVFNLFSNHKENVQNFGKEVADLIDKYKEIINATPMDSHRPVGDLVEYTDLVIKNTTILCEADINKILFTITNKVKGVPAITNYYTAYNSELHKINNILHAMFFNKTNIKKIEELPERLMKLVKKLVNSGLESALQAKNALIIIAGNQDELFEGSNELWRTYKDVDSTFDENKKLKWADLKQLLLQKLKPEQISRLGMIHIIFPTLSEKSYKQIINDRIKVLQKTCKKSFGITLTVTQNFKDIIYRNGVFPTQGVRPLLSLLDSCIGNYIIQTCSKYKNEKVEVDIDEQKRELVVKTKKNTERIKLILEISDSDIHCGGEARLLTAVHEAGHAICYMWRFGLPVYIDMAPVANWAGAYTAFDMPDAIWERIGMYHETLLSKTVCTLGGKAAEALVFGNKMGSAGAFTDLEQATGRVLSLLRSCGYTNSDRNGYMSHSYTHAIDSVDKINVMDETIQKEAQDILESCSHTATDILFKCSLVLKKMVGFLMNKPYLSKKDSEVFLKEVSKIRGNCGDYPLIAYDPMVQYEMWVKSISEIEKEESK